uniref:uncharacterized protein C1orf131-like n=1 Tax=Styela clava TaxID=7725 RepID=UPI00193A3EEB|nr:uncharacterized protein C1orf131-like [Styela clava]
MTKRRRHKMEIKDIVSIKEADNDKILSILDKYASEFLGETQPKETQPNTPTILTTVMTKEENDNKLKKEVEIVIFKSRKTKNEEPEIKKASPTIVGTDSKFNIPKCKYTNERLNSSEVLEKLKFSVGSFGMKAFSKEEQREHERKRAIKLGAKPTKRKYVNYKILMEEQKRLKQDTSSGNNILSNNRTEYKEKPSGMPKFWKQGDKSLNPQIGKYKDGVLKLSSKDIKSVNRRR